MSSRCQSPSSAASNGSSSSADQASTVSSLCRRSTRSTTPSIDSSFVSNQQRSDLATSWYQSEGGEGQPRLPATGSVETTSRVGARLPERQSSNDPSWLVSIRNLNRTGSPLRPSNLHMIQELQRRNESQEMQSNGSINPHHYAGSSRPSYQRALSNNARSCLTHQMSQHSLRSNGEESLRRYATERSRGRVGALDASDHSAAADARIAAQRSKIMAQQQLASFGKAMGQATMMRAPPPPTRYQRRESLGSVDNTSIYSQHSHPSPPPPPPPPPLPPMPENVGRLERGLYQERSFGAPLRPGAYHHCPAPPPLPVRQLTGGRSNHSSSGPPMFGYETSRAMQQSRYETSAVAYGSSRSVGPDGPFQHSRANRHAGIQHQPFQDRFRHPSSSTLVSQAPRQSSEDLKVEISPNVWVRLRGADETWACVEQDFFMPVVCFGCASELCCIQDADFVLCPMCRVVSPMDGIVDAASSDGGVGLGFTFDDLMKWQSDIMRSRQQQQQPQPQRSQQASRSRLGLLAS